MGSSESMAHCAHEEVSTTHCGGMPAIFHLDGSGTLGERAVLREDVGDSDDGVDRPVLQELYA